MEHPLDILVRLQKDQDLLKVRRQLEDLLSPFTDHSSYEEEKELIDNILKIVYEAR